jgi:hypothetical protein
MEAPNFEVSGNPTIGLSGIPILSQFPLEFYYYRETGIKDYQDNSEKKSAQRPGVSCAHETLN